MWKKRGKSDLRREKGEKIVENSRESQPGKYSRISEQCEGPFDTGSTLIYNHESVLLKSFLQQCLAT